MKMDSHPSITEPLYKTAAHLSSTSHMMWRMKLYQVSVWGLLNMETILLVTADLSNTTNNRKLQNFQNQCSQFVILFGLLKAQCHFFVIYCFFFICFYWFIINNFFIIYALFCLFLNFFLYIYFHLFIIFTTFTIILAFIIYYFLCNFRYFILYF